MAPRQKKILIAAVIVMVIAAVVVGVYYLIQYLIELKATQNARAYNPNASDQGTKNLNAFLRVIRQGESGQGSDAYCMKVGGGYFTDPSNPDFSAYPTNAFNAALDSDAVGAYQIISTTWQMIINNMGPMDFSPPSQDKSGVWLISYHGAYDNVIAGNFTAAIAACGVEWASLSSSPYGQPTQTLAQEQAIFSQYGGVAVS